MAISIHFNIKEYLLNKLKELTNNLSTLKVNNLGNGNIQCIWNISSIDKFRVEFSKSYFYAIRLYDISNNRAKNNSTCIMKEIQVNKFQSSISFPIPINKGVYYFEFGYRNRNGDWRKIASQEMNLGYRIKKIIKVFDNENWFTSEIQKRSDFMNYHEEAYQLSLSNRIGGSEKTIN